MKRMVNSSITVYDEPSYLDITHVDEIFEGMICNASDDQIDKFGAVVDKVCKLLKANERDVAIIITSEADVDGGEAINGRFGTLYYFADVPVVCEKNNGYYWFYFRSEEDAEKLYRTFQVEY